MSERLVEECRREFGVGKYYRQEFVPAVSGGLEVASPELVPGAAELLLLSI